MMETVVLGGDARTYSDRHMVRRPRATLVCFPRSCSQGAAPPIQGQEDGIGWGRLFCWDNVVWRGVSVRQWEVELLRFDDV